MGFGLYVNEGSDDRAGSGRGRIKARILLPFTLLIVVLAGGFLTSAYRDMKQRYERDLAESVQAAENLFSRDLENDAAKMRTALEAVVRNGSVKAAFLAGDREALLRLTRPLFDELRKKHDLTHFYFTGVDRVNFLRVHAPERYGDVIDRATTIQAGRSGEEAHGLEIGQLGTLAYRVVMPWFDGGRLIGYVEMGHEVEHLIEEIHQVLGIDVALLLDKSLLDRQRWEAGMRMLGREADWGRFRSAVVVGHTMDRIPEGVAQLVAQSDNRYESPVMLEENGRELYVAFLPVIDTAMREVGNLVIALDVTETMAAYRESVVKIVAFCFIAGGAAFLLFYIILSGVEGDVTRYTNWLSAEVRRRTRAEKVVRKSEERLQAITQSALDAIIAVDDKGYIVSWNTGARKIFGYGGDEIVGKPVTTLMPERYRTAHIKGLAWVSAGGEGHIIGKTVELFGLRKDGSEFPMEMSLSTWLEGERHFFSGIIRDITAKRREVAALSGDASEEDPPAYRVL